MIGENIQRIRKKKGLTLSELAERAQISKSYLSNMERNLNKNPSIQIIEKIAAVLNVNFHVLLGTMSDQDTFPENEWFKFVNDLRESGVESDQLKEYKSVIEFAKWRKEMSDEDE